LVSNLTKIEQFIVNLINKKIKNIVCIIK